MTPWTHPSSLPPSTPRNENTVSSRSTPSASPRNANRSRGNSWRVRFADIFRSPRLPEPLRITPINSPKKGSCNPTDKNPNRIQEPLWESTPENIVILDVLKSGNLRWDVRMQPASAVACPAYPPSPYYYPDPDTPALAPNVKVAVLELDGGPSSSWLGHLTKIWGPVVVCSSSGPITLRSVLDAIYTYCMIPLSDPEISRLAPTEAAMHSLDIARASRYYLLNCKSSLDQPAFYV
ncbi:hypothetical protein GALMADRAFT_134737 [Galerina marginata CBS 339.88]|uniref:DUF6699 domain-containing protein n=1 Tax=Galerina marginata (strain CBS 339.88) TaxID=685588 RepID=A0A067TW67_GALM3|nr:hypothetical protein GALMADRAFT_134737 [Galerina marginata CBS 339.88]